MTQLTYREPAGSRTAQARGEGGGVTPCTWELGRGRREEAASEAQAALSSETTAQLLLLLQRSAPRLLASESLGTGRKGLGQD